MNFRTGSGFRERRQSACCDCRSKEACRFQRFLLRTCRQTCTWRVAMYENTNVPARTSVHTDLSCIVSMMVRLVCFPIVSPDSAFRQEKDKSLSPSLYQWTFNELQSVHFQPSCFCNATRAVGIVSM